MYLTAVIDWYSRYVLSWRLSNTLDGRFCLEALEEALGVGRPEIFNTDQGVAVHGAGVHRPPGGGRGRGEQGRSGAGVGQRVRGAAVAVAEIRGGVLESISKRERDGVWPGGLVRGSTTTSGPIRAWAIGPPPRSIAARSRSGLEGWEGSRA